MSNSGKWLRTSFFWLLALLAIAVVIIFIFRPQSNVTQANVSTLLNHLQADMKKNQQDTLTVSSNILTLTRGKGNDAPKEAATINDSFDITKVLKDNNIDYTNNSLLILQYESPNNFWNWLGTLGGLIPFLLLGGLLIFMVRQAQGSNNQAMSFGKSRARMFMGNKPTVTFTDVAGVEEAKQ